MTELPHREFLYYALIRFLTEPENIGSMAKTKITWPDTGNKALIRYIANDTENQLLHRTIILWAKKTVPKNYTLVERYSLDSNDELELCELEWKPNGSS
jgi:hypothetical protein